jgi:hypothetical protein
MRRPSPAATIINPQAPDMLFALFLTTVEIFRLGLVVCYV